MRNCQSLDSLPQLSGIPTPDFELDSPLAPVEQVRKEHRMSCPACNFSVVPTLPKDGVIPKIHHSTACDIIEGRYKDFFDRVSIVDCRYKYEFDDGHIKGAINLQNSELLEEIFFKNPGERVVVLFHCELSMNRGPEFAALFRELDRRLNFEQYPRLYYPDVFVIAGGYREFYSQHSDLCVGGYTRMLDSRHRSNGDLAKFTTLYRKNVKLVRLRCSETFSSLPIGFSPEGLSTA